MNEAFTLSPDLQDFVDQIYDLLRTSNTTVFSARYCAILLGGNLDDTFEALDYLAEQGVFTPHLIGATTWVYELK